MSVKFLRRIERMMKKQRSGLRWTTFGFVHVWEDDRGEIARISRLRGQWRVEGHGVTEMVRLRTLTLAKAWAEENVTRIEESIAVSGSR